MNEANRFSIEAENADHFAILSCDAYPRLNRIVSN